MREEVLFSRKVITCQWFDKDSAQIVQELEFEFRYLYENLVSEEYVCKFVSAH